MSKPLDPSTLMTLARQNFIAKATWWADKCPIVSHETSRLFSRVDSSLSSDTFNVVIPKGGDRQEVEIALKRILGHYGLKKKAMSLWMWDLPDTLFWQQATAKLGIVPDEMALIMVHPNVGKHHPAPKKPDNIQKMITDDDVKAFGLTVSKVFGDDPEAQSVMGFYQALAPYHQSNNDRYQLYLKYDGDHPVSTICLFDDGATIGLYDMATIPTAQGKGHANDLFQYALTLAKEKGRPIILAASDMGKGLYKKHGFSEVGDIAIMNLRPA